MGNFGIPCLLAIGSAVGLSLLFAFPVKWCWNFTIPYLFGFPVLTWGKAWCLSFLSSVLIKGVSLSSKK